MLLPELESPEVAGGASAIRKAIASLALDVDAIVILTPHGTKAGVYREVVGDLSAFGIHGIEAKTDTDPEVVDALGMPRLEGPIDHGVLVPLLLAGWQVPVVGVAMDGDARCDLETDKRVAVVASVNLSAGLSERAPLTALDGAGDGETRFLSALERDIADAATIDLPGSCVAPVMSVFARSFAGRRARVLAHEAPVGVGYLVAAVV